MINSDIAPTQDGEPKVNARMCQIANNDTVNTCFIVVLGWNNIQGFFIKNSGCGIMYEQFLRELDASETNSASLELDVSNADTKTLLVQ